MKASEAQNKTPSNHKSWGKEQQLNGVTRSVATWLDPAVASAWSDLVFREEFLRHFPDLFSGTTRTVHFRLDHRVVFLVEYNARSVQLNEDGGNFGAAHHNDGRF